MDEVKVDIEPTGIATVTIDRPEKRNAVSLAMWRGLRDSFRELDADPAARAIILTGAGGHFCAGADISEFAAVRSTEEDGRIYDEASDGCEDALNEMTKPTIAAIDGACVGGGLGLALCCDFRFASGEARFGITAARLSIVYGLPETQKLYNVVGAAAAKRILFGGDVFDAEEALRLGLLQEVVDGEALPAARAFAERICGNAPISLAGAKFIVNAIMAGNAQASANKIEAMVLGALASEDYVEGQRAFAEKRLPRFVGR